MKEKILTVIAERIEYYKSQVSKTKRVKKSISIWNENVSPKNLIQFMRDNNIPEDAEFDASCDGYDGFDDFLLSWYIEVPKTEKDITEGVKKTLNLNIFSSIAGIYLWNGYTRISQDYDQYKKFKNTTVYDMYMNGEYELLVEYFNSYFQKNNQ